MAAAAGAVSVAVGGVDWSSFVGAAALVAAALTELYLVRDRPDRRWYEGRAAAESAKTLGWRYAVGAEPFGVEALSGRDADLLLIQRLDEVLTDLDDLATEPPRGRAEQITPAMRAVRAAPLPVRRAVYERWRTGEALEWYRTKSAWNQRRARQRRRLGLQQRGRDRDEHGVALPELREDLVPPCLAAAQPLVDPDLMAQVPDPVEERPDAFPVLPRIGAEQLQHPRSAVLLQDRHVPPHGSEIYASQTYRRVDHNRPAPVCAGRHRHDVTRVTGLVGLVTSWAGRTTLPPGATPAV